MNWKNFLNGERLRSTTRNNSGGDNRNEFESDYGRVMFSPAVRRMHDKTQVQPLTTDDNIHSRLTHSMEVMSVGYSMGIRLCNDEEFVLETQIEKNVLERVLPTIIQNACLVHDIGNPPFGHFGETIVKDYFKNFFFRNEYKIQLSIDERADFTSFDGNAQGFRVLTKLQYINDLYGLNLTYSTLATYLKYPCLSEGKGSISKKKKGVFNSECDYLSAIADGCGLKNADDSISRHPLVYIVEAADSICYYVMDIEDGFNKKWYSYDQVKQSLSENEKCLSIIQIVEEKIKQEYLAIDRDPSEISENEYIVRLRIALIGYLVGESISVFKGNLEAICNGHYHKELLDDDSHNVAKTLQTFCVNNIFSKRDVISLELTGHSVITGLLDYYIKFMFTKSDRDGKDSDYQKRAKGMISKSIIYVAMMENKLPLESPICLLPDYYKLRIIVDFISGMTDQFALNHLQKLSGQKIL